MDQPTDRPLPTWVTVAIYAVVWGLAACLVGWAYWWAQPFAWRP